MDVAPRVQERASGDMPFFEPFALELFALQFELNPLYRRFCEARNVRADTVTHWTGIPAVPTSAFKKLEVSCLPPEARTAVFHSSGTTAHQPSRHLHNAASLAVYEASVLAWFKAHFQFPAANCQLAILTPPPADAPHSSLVHMFQTIRREIAPTESAFVGSVHEDGAWTVDLEAALQILRKACASGQPVLVPGTAFSFVQLLDRLAERSLRLELPPGSCAMETGGYKGRSRTLPKAALHAFISQRFGIPLNRIVSEYGMSELSSQAYDSQVGWPGAEPPLAANPNACFCFPPWARVQIISPETGREVGEGETGLIRVFDLANVYSVMAIQTEDLGIRRGDGFALVGRAAAAEPRGCSLLAG